jgi:ABC-2 type transport system permease protein
MKILKIFSVEFGCQLRAVSTGLYAAVLLVFTIMMNLVTTPGDGVYANNTFHITATTVIGGLIWLLMGAAVAGEAAARDMQTGMYPLIYTTPVPKLSYLGGRFLAALTVNAVLVLILPFGVLLSFYLPGMGQDELLPFRPWAYLSVSFLICLPNVFVATALQFTFAALSRRVRTSYLAGLLLAVFPQMVAITAAALFGKRDLVKLLDPVGVAGIVGSELGTWTAVEKNTRLITLEGMFLWNRILWFCIALGALLLTWSRFSFTAPVTGSRLGRFTCRPKVQVAASGNRERLVQLQQPEQQWSLSRSFGEVLAL